MTEEEKIARLIAYKYKQYLVKYTNSYRNMFRRTPVNKTKGWKYYLKAAKIVKEINASIEDWVSAQFWARSRFLYGIYPPSMLSGPKAVKYYIDYCYRQYNIEEISTDIQQVYLDKLVKIYGLTEKQALKIFSKEGIFTKEFCKEKLSSTNP